MCSSPEEDHPRHHEVHVGGAERAWPAHPASRVAADADEVDVGLAVDLPAAQEEGVDPPLRGAIEQLDATVRERVVPLAAQDRDAQAPARTLARQESRGARNRRGGADRNMGKPIQHPCQDVDQQLLGPMVDHSAATRSSTNSSR